MFRSRVTACGIRRGGNRISLRPCRGFCLFVAWRWRDVMVGGPGFGCMAHRCRNRCCGLRGLTTGLLRCLRLCGPDSGAKITQYFRLDFDAFCRMLPASGGTGKQLCLPFLLQSWMEGAHTCIPVPRWAYPSEQCNCCKECGLPDFVSMPERSN